MSSSLPEVYFTNTPRYQRYAERIAYKVDTTPYGGSPTNVSQTLELQHEDGSHEDVSNDKLAGSQGLEGNVITTKLVTHLEAEKTYRLTVQFTSGGNTFAMVGLLVGIA